MAIVILLSYWSQNTPAIVAVGFGVMAIVRYLRLWTLPSKKFQGFDVALAGRDGSVQHRMDSDVALLAGTRLALLDGLIFLVLWASWFLIDSPRFPADRMLLRRIFDLPWLGSGFYAYFLMQKTFAGFRFERVPRVP